MRAPYIPFYVDDFDGATAHLSPAEEGIYMRLIKLAWRSPGCGFANDLALIARKCRVTVVEVEPVLNEFFKLSRGRWFQPRLKREHDKLANTKRELSEAGRRGGFSKALKQKGKNSGQATNFLKQPEPEAKPEAEEVGTPHGRTYRTSAQRNEASTVDAFRQVFGGLASGAPQPDATAGTTEPAGPGG